MADLIKAKAAANNRIQRRALRAVADAARWLGRKKMMVDAQRQPTLDDFAPKTQFHFPDGSLLVVGTKRDDDAPLRYGVHLVYDSGRNAEPEMNILLPPHSIDALIPIL